MDIFFASLGHKGANRTSGHGSSSVSTRSIEQPNAGSFVAEHQDVGSVDPTSRNGHVDIRFPTRPAEASSVEVDGITPISSPDVREMISGLQDTPPHYASMMRILNLRIGMMERCLDEANKR